MRLRFDWRFGESLGLQARRAADELEAGSRAFSETKQSNSNSNSNSIFLVGVVWWAKMERIADEVGVRI
jgi:hypothetical protein